MATDVSLLKPLGYQTRTSECGYCKGSQGSSSYYLRCENMRIDHYQELVDRGWRRSGHLYYKPDLTRSCCPHYTIRLQAKEFKARREQRQAVNRWNDFILGPDYKRKAAMLCPQSKEEKRIKRDKFDLLDAIHKAEYQNIKRPTSKLTKNPIEPAHRFEINLEPDSFSKEKHQLLIKYQKEIHKEAESRWTKGSFTQFLCSGLKQQILKIHGKTKKLGSYHQCYRVDGKLVAVAVLDLLASAVSSVYLFYDPEYQHWEFGKLSAMREIALAEEQKCEWYYMGMFSEAWKFFSNKEGYYIHSCVKMRYKGTFEPSYILDPESLGWDILNDDLRKKLDQRKYVSLSRDRKVEQYSSANGIVKEAVIVPEDQDLIANEASEKSEPRKQAPNTPEDIEEDSDPSDIDDIDIPEGSLFDYNIPGVLKKEEVRMLDLDHWKIVVRSILVDFEDIRGWEDQSLDDEQSIKSIVGELAATIGPKLLENSAVNLF